MYKTSQAIIELEGEVTDLKVENRAYNALFQQLSIQGSE